MKEIGIGGEHGTQWYSLSLEKKRYLAQISPRMILLSLLHSNQLRLAKVEKKIELQKVRLSCTPKNIIENFSSKLAKIENENKLQNKSDYSYAFS